MWPFTPKPARLNLALQGGGAHGAFTWGVLDALLEQAPFSIAAASGASAGAMNAVALAHGLAVGGRDGARQSLETFWTAIGSQLPFDGWVVGEGDEIGLHPGVRLWMQWAQGLTPEQLNPLDLNPLRNILQKQIDFERLRRPDALPLHIATTHANSGQLRLFGNDSLDCDVVLASGCLPMIHRAVLIDGEPHWDGAYSANPALHPLLFDRRAAADTLLVLLAPLAWMQAPQGTAEIRERALAIAFNNTLLRELGLLAQLQPQARSSLLWRAGPIERRLVRSRWHLIDAHPSLAALSSETRMIAHLPFLLRLRDAGRAQAIEWLAGAGRDVGRQSSVDLLSRFAPDARAHALSVSHA